MFYNLYNFHWTLDTVYGVIGNTVNIRGFYLIYLKARAVAPSTSWTNRGDAWRLRRRSCRPPWRRPRPPWSRRRTRW